MQTIGPVEMFWMNALAPTLAARDVLRPRPARTGLGQSTSTRPVPGGRVERRDVTLPEGVRTVRLFVPDETPRGLVLMLHGCRQSPDDFARATNFDRLAARHGLLVAYPGQLRSQNPLGCWQWFLPRNQQRDRGEPAILAGLVRVLVAAHGIEASPVFAAGLSAGGAMAATLGTLHPELFTAVGIHSGLPFAAARDVRSAFEAMAGNGAAPRTPLRRPAIVFHGTADRTVHVSNADRLMQSLAVGPTRKARFRLTTGSARGRRYSQLTLSCSGTADRSELWLIEGAGHAWSGGSPTGSYADPLGPDASAEMLRFFLARARSQPLRGAAVATLRAG